MLWMACLRRCRTICLSRPDKHYICSSRVGQAGNCSQCISVFTCPYHLVQDVKLTQAWLAALHQGGYVFPQLVSHPGQHTQHALPQRNYSGQNPDQRKADSKPEPPAGTQSAWVVILSHSDVPSAAVKKPASLPGWNVVVVADIGSSEGGPSSKSKKEAWSLPQLTYLDEEWQESLPFSVLPHLPWKGSR